MVMNPIGIESVKNHQGKTNPKYPPCFASVERRGPTFHHIRLVHRLAPAQAEENAVFLGHRKAGRIT